MSCLRPATPGFVVTLAATILLAVVSFSVPYVKSVYFLKASISADGVNGSIIFGTLGYCVELSNGTTCSKPSVGYQLDINSLVGNQLPIQIPDVVVKWITTALVLHVAALIVAAISAFFGLLAHVREMSMTCCSTFISGFAALIALAAFVFDLVLFFVAKARISSVGTASIGSAIWLTLAAWVLLFFSGCFYSCGKNCISKRPTKKHYDDNEYGAETRRANSYKERSDAVRAEADRKARQKQSERGLPEMPQIETEPLTSNLEDPQTGIIDGDEVRINPRQGSRQQTSSSGGYVPRARGTTAMDDYYNNRPNNTYPPPNPYPQNSYPTPNSYPPPNAYSTPNVYPPSQQFSVPSHASNVAQSVTPHYGAYGYTPSPPAPDGLSSFSATGPGQNPNYNPNPYGEIRTSPSPHQDSLLDPPRPSPYSSISPLLVNRSTASPNVIHPSPPPQQNQRGYTLRDDSHETQRLQLSQSPSNPYVIQPLQQLGHSNYTLGGVDYEAQPTSSQPTSIPYVPSPPPLQNLQPGYTSGDGNYETRRPRPPSNPYVINQANDQPLYGGYTLENNNYEVESPQPPRPPLPPSNPYVIHSSLSPEESRRDEKSNYIPGGVDHRRSPDDSPPVYRD